MEDRYLTTYLKISGITDVVAAVLDRHDQTVYLETVFGWCDASSLDFELKTRHPKRAAASARGFAKYLDREVHVW